MHKLKKNSAYTVAYDSRGRGAYIFAFPAKKPDRETRQVLSDVLIKVCAEPAPDASANLQANTASKFGLDVTLAYQAISGALKTNQERTDTASSTVVDVVQRTELVLVLREALYRLCEMNLNGVLTDEGAVDLFTDVLTITKVLGQRDNVGKLISILGDADTKLTDPARERLIQLVSSLTAIEAASNARNNIVRAAATVSAVKSLTPNMGENETRELLRNLIPNEGTAPRSSDRAPPKPPR